MVYFLVCLAWLRRLLVEVFTFLFERQEELVVHLEPCRQLVNELLQFLPAFMYFHIAVYFYMLLGRWLGQEIFFINFWLVQQQYAKRRYPLQRYCHGHQKRNRVVMGFDAQSHDSAGKRARKKVLDGLLHLKYLRLNFLLMFPQVPELFEMSSDDRFVG